MLPAVIAVVDDNDLVRAATASLLRSCMYQSLVFASVADLLATDTAAIACIVSDIQMPGLSGFDLHRLLGERGIIIPMILMTADATPATRERADRLGIAALLEKPIDCDALLAAIDQAIAVTP